MASKGETAATTMLLLVALVMSFTSTTVTADPVVIPNPIDIVGPGLNLFCSLRVNNGKPCNDSNVCTLNDKCMNGKCKGTASKICLDVDNIACTVPACDPVKGCYMKPVDSKCPGFPLNKCLLPKCDPRTGCTSTPRNCDDNNACTVDSCHPLLGCVRKPIKCDDGNPCTRDWCHTKLGCQHTPAPGLKCDDGNRCTVGDKCDANGQCQPGTQELSCNDNNPCTLDRCDPKGGCIHTPLTGTACDDGKKCTIGDRCVEGKCVGITKNCDDGNICTADRCNPNTGDCVHVGLTGQQCNDNIPCTTGDQCVQGVCRGIPQDVLCNDNNPCTLDKCSPTGGCIYKGLSDVACNDGDKCTTTDKCVEGKCVGTPTTCGDGNQCTADRCDPDTGNCINRPLSGMACDDGFACTVEDQCIEGKCQGKPVDSLCDDKNECTVEKCILTGGCVRKPIEDGSTCDDGDKCTVEDQCKDGRCVGKRLTDCVASGRTP